MPDILTITLNPALDVSTTTHRVTDTHKLRCGPARLDPGGGGINVARVLHRLGASCLALYPAGGVTGARLRELLQIEQVHSHCIPIQAETRESFSVSETSSAREYRFVLPGPQMAQAEWAACLEAIGTHVATARHVVASGSLPPGAPPDAYARIAALAPMQGKALVVDSSGPALAAALQAGVYMIKPSLRELRELTGEPLSAERDWVHATRHLIEQGRTRIVALSLGQDGALLVSADQALRARAIDVPVAGAIGAGDSFVAGLIWALDRGESMADAFGAAMAAGAAALLSAGTSLSQAEDIHRLRGMAVVTRL